ncbi:Hypothetical predicted protein, partial [Paramuricea clavata]
MLNKTSRKCKSLTEMTSELNLKQIIESPTRITDISQSLIGVILVSYPNTIRDSGVLNCTISDTCPFNDVNEKLKIFDAVLQTLDSHAPIKTLKVRDKPRPFVTPEIKELMDKRDRLHGLFLKTRNHSDWCNFKAARNAVKTG